MATRRIREFLDGNRVQYITVIHSPAYSAQEVAASAHIPGRLMAKNVIVRVNGRLAMAVVAATRDVNLEALRQESGALDVMLATEEDFADRFPDCQLGTVPPLGNLFGMETFVDRDLARRHEIAFAAGTHTHLIVMKAADYLRLAKPILGRFAVQHAARSLNETLSI